MPRKIALKRLTASDLTLFRWHFDNQNAGNQKSINLNADVFISELYPTLPDAPEAADGRLPIDLYLYGPGLAGELNLQRKIIKGGTYKNWRLDGEFIQEEAERFKHLRPGDFAIIEFIGNIVPTRARALFVAAAVAEDRALHVSLSTLLASPGGRQSMRTVAEDQLDRLISHVGLNPAHPANEFILDAALEDAAYGGDAGIRRLLSRRSGRAISQGDLRRARAEAEQTGEIGEEFVNDYLDQKVQRGEITAFRWVSSENPVAPFDFEAMEGEQTVQLDVKSTRGEFGRRLHISLGELVAMANSAGRYDLYRIYEIGDRTAKLRVARDVREFALRILAPLGNLPEGTAVDSVSVLAAAVGFDSTVIDLTLRSDDE